MPMTAKQMVRLLKKNGCIELRQTGSHKVFYCPETRAIIPVPMHNRDLKKGTEQAILKSAGLFKGERE